MDLKNKIAIVTGISKGIGLGTAQQLLDKRLLVVGWRRNNQNRGSY